MQRLDPEVMTKEQFDIELRSPLFVSEQKSASVAARVAEEEMQLFRSAKRAMGV